MQSARTQRPASRVATRAVSVSGGRFRIALVLLAFMVMSGVVILRRTYGIARAQELRGLDSRRAALVAERLRLEAEIRAASSRSHLQPVVEQRLQMRVPSDSQIFLLPRAAHDSP